jgi:CubicO group peptidase (beta-lactamase class C family)
MAYRAGLLSVILFITIVLSCAPALSEQPDYWPTEGWRTSTPEAQGMDSETLAALIEKIHERGRHIRDVIVIRNGYLVLDSRFHPFPENSRHIIHSCTKTVMGTLIGIAIDQGFIDSVDQKVMDFFPDKRSGFDLEGLDAGKETMTLEHLLTMSSGLDCQDSYLYEWRGLAEMTRNLDWVQYMLDLPMAHEPGARFEYCNGASYLLSAILQKTTGKTALAYAKENLFGPLGIDDVAWPINRAGIATGWGGIEMRPRDLTKIAYLMLKKGAWEGNQLVSSGWIDAATESHIAAGTLSDSYGYQLWPNEAGYFMMLGHGGQYVIVHPEHKLIFAVISCLQSRDFFLPRQWYHEFVLPAVRSSSSLTENAEGSERLASIVDAVANPAPAPVPPLPPMAGMVSGKRYVFDDNPMQFKSIEVEFEGNGEEASLHLVMGRSIIRATIGLDHVYRVGHNAGRWRAYRGYWEDGNTFVIEYEVADHTERGFARMVFDGDTVGMVVSGDIRDVEIELIGRLVPETPESN